MTLVPSGSAKQLEGQRGQPVEPTTRGHNALGPRERVGHLEACRGDISFAALALEPGRPIARHDIPLAVPAHEPSVRQRGQALENAHRIGSDGREISEHDMAIDAALPGDIGEHGVERDRVAVDVCEDREPH
jgi:hypothetical protein